MNQPTTVDVLARARLLRKLCKETWENAQYLCNTNESATAVEYAMFRDTEVTLRGVKKRNSLMKKRLLNERESYMDGRADLHRELEEIERDADLIEDIDQWLLVFRNNEVSNRRSMLRSNRHNPRPRFGNHYVIGITTLGLVVLAISLTMGRIPRLESGFF
ncbi:hypothetical protein PG988_006760 [Apiospora saccharicola]